MPTADEQQRKADLERQQRSAEMAAANDAADGSMDDPADASFDPDGQSSTGPRISPFEGFAMLGMALVFDGMEFLLNFVFLAFLVAFFAWLTFFVWFNAKGMGFSTKLMNAIKKGDIMSIGKNPAVINAGAALIGMLPVIGALPQYTFGILVIILIEYADYAMKTVLGKAGLKFLSKKVLAQ